MLHFGTAPRPEPEADDETLEEDRVTLDIWNWKDPYLQPMQLVQADDERNRTYAAAAHLDSGTVVQLGTIGVPTVRFAAESDATHALGVTDMPYRQLLSWDGRYNDLYAVDLASGERRRLAEKVGRFARAAISPGGEYAAWWNGAERQWRVARLDDGELLTASAAVSHPVWNELDDHPHDPPPYGAAGWTASDGAFLFYDRFDVWRFEPESGRTVNLTAGAGRASQIRFRYARTEPELDHIPEGEALWQAFHDRNKLGGFYRGRTDRETSPGELVMTDKSFRLRGKAKDADRWLLTREDFREFPDLWVTARCPSPTCSGCRMPIPSRRIIAGARRNSSNGPPTTASSCRACFSSPTASILRRSTPCSCTSTSGCRTASIRGERPGRAAHPCRFPSTSVAAT